MDRIEKAFEPAFETMTGARESLDEFHTFCQEFYSKRAVEGWVENDPKTGEQIYKARYHHPLPLKANRKALEALSHGRHALDQVAYACRDLTIGHTKDEENFPWVRNEKDLRGRLKRGMDERLWPVFLDIKPYFVTEREVGGLDRVRSLAVLTNKKHTTGLKFAPQPSLWQMPLHAVHPGTSIKRYGPHEHWDVEKSEGIMMRWRGRVDILGDPWVGVSVAIVDQRMPGWHPAWESIDEFLTWGEMALNRLKQACHEIFDSEGEAPKASTLLPENETIKISEAMISIACPTCIRWVKLSEAPQTVKDRHRNYSCLKCGSKLLTIRPYLHPRPIVHRPGYRFGDWVFDNPTDAFITAGLGGFVIPGGGNVLPPPPR